MRYARWKESGGLKSVFAKDLCVGSLDRDVGEGTGKA
jgi:hypothetical protein